MLHARVLRGRCTRGTQVLVQKRELTILWHKYVMLPLNLYRQLKGENNLKVILQPLGSFCGGGVGCWHIPKIQN